jgi:hypothetical protein
MSSPQVQETLRGFAIHIQGDEHCRSNTFVGSELTAPSSLWQQLNNLKVLQNKHATLLCLMKLIYTEKCDSLKWQFENLVNELHSNIN